MYTTRTKKKSERKKKGWMGGNSVRQQSLKTLYNKQREGEISHFKQIDAFKEGNTPNNTIHVQKQSLCSKVYRKKKSLELKPYIVLNYFFLSFFLSSRFFFCLQISLNTHTTTIPNVPYQAFSFFSLSLPQTNPNSTFSFSLPVDIFVRFISIVLIMSEKKPKKKKGQRE
ncbi:hypothetical protein GGI42DRAFT_267060 [Trichoderma sp. SZMC 28013]